MADAGFFKGTSADQDRRFSDKELKLLKSMKFPAHFEKKVDMRKINLTVIRPWIAKKIIELVGFEDEVVVEYAMGLLEDEQQPTPDPKKMQINLTGFLTKDTPAFMSALWKLLLEAQEEVSGVPRTFVEMKKEEMRRARENDTRAIDERDRRSRLDEIRDGDDRGGRGGRGRGGRGRGRGGRGGFDDDRGGRPRDGGWGARGGGPGPGGFNGGHRRPISRSPPPRRRSPSDIRSSLSPVPMRRHRSPPRRRSPSRDSRSPEPVRRRSPPRRSPPRRARSRTVSRSPPPARRRPRSPSFTPPVREQKRRFRDKDSRSPPARRRRLSPGVRSRSDSASRSRSPPARGYPRRRSVSPPRRKRSESPPRRRRRTPSDARSSPSPPPRRRSPSGTRRPAGKSSRRLSRSPSPDSRSASRSTGRRENRMDVDAPSTGPELKIKGQAEIERRKSKWENEAADDRKSKDDLERRENELKEKALRNKVLRSRKVD